MTRRPAARLARRLLVLGLATACAAPIPTPSAGDLRATLPSQVAGEPLTRATPAGPAFVDANEDFRLALAIVGRDPEDLFVATADPSPGSRARVSIQAVRLAGVEPVRFLNAVRKSMLAGGVPRIALAQLDVGGKRVTRFASMERGTRYGYAVDSRLYILLTEFPDEAAEVLSGLP